MTELRGRYDCKNISVKILDDIDRCLFFSGPCKGKQDGFACALCVTVFSQKTRTVYPETLRKSYLIWLPVFDRVCHRIDQGKTGN